MTDCDLTHARAATLTVDQWIDKYVMSSKRATSRKTEWYKQMLADQAAIHAPPPPPDVPGVFVSPTGSDTTGDGSQSKPWLTPTKAKPNETVYFRGGIYPISASLKALAGQTWSYFPPDGYNSAVLDGGSTSASSGTPVIILIDGISGFTLDGLELTGFRQCAVNIHGNQFVGPAHGNTIRNCDIHHGSYDITGFNSGYGGSPIFGRGDLDDLTIDHNATHDVPTAGINIAIGDGAHSHWLDNYDIYSNAVFNVCQKVNDAGGIYAQDIGTDSFGRIHDNFVRDCGNGRSIYLDDGTSNATVYGNVMAGLFDIACTVHGGKQNKWHGNLVDITAFSPNGPLVFLFQGSSISTDHLGVEWTNSIVISRATRWPVYKLSYPALIGNNLYWSYAGAQIDATGDTNPTRKDPKLSGRDYQLAADSPAYAAPVSFPQLKRDWGPPGYVIPAGTPPSYA